MPIDTSWIDSFLYCDGLYYCRVCKRVAQAEETLILGITFPVSVRCNQEGHGSWEHRSRKILKDTEEEEQSGK
jgi:hypothetical protein